ncbi:MAG TPA: hypothetical protein VGD81_02225 [Opitutaceae bacterium]
MKANASKYRVVSSMWALATTLLFAGACSTERSPQASPRNTAEAQRRAESQATFIKIASVLRHPRCINCHPAADFPRQGDEGRRHDQLVMRGPENHGAPALQCRTCHQDANQDDRIPGAPHWGLAPISMAWDGLDDHDLAESLKDQAKNGGRSLEALHEHMAHDPLVAWAWNPGGSRKPPPISHEEFGRLIRQWIDTGAVSPDKSTATQVATQ